MPPRLFAVIPAAGHSRRMGRPKLLLPLGSQTVIAHLLAVLQRPEITDRCVVVRRDDAELQAAVTSATGTVLIPSSDPPDMRSSVEFALEQIAEQHSPQPDDGWLLIPADHPLLEPAILEELIRRWQETTAPILVPRHGNRRGHPTFFRWSLAQEIAAIPPDQGLNWLLHQHAGDVLEVPMDDPAVVTDLDTPEDYARLRERWESGRK